MKTLLGLISVHSKPDPKNCDWFCLEWWTVFRLSLPDSLRHHFRQRWVHRPCSRRSPTCDVDISLDRYLYLFGPRVSVRPMERFRIYAQAMVGGVQDQTDVTFTGAGRSVTNSNSADAWAFDFGVGADWRFTNHWSWRIIQADYLATTFSSPNNDRWQNNWRLSTGIVFSFGGKEPTRPVDYSKEAPISVK